MKPGDVARFVKQGVRPRLGPDYSIYTKRDLIRRRGPFVQAIFFGIKRSGWLNVIPTLYVLGADPSAEVIFQTMSLPISGVDDCGKWRWPSDTPLDDMLAMHVIAQVEKDSPISFFQPLIDKEIDAALKLFSERVQHWVPSLSLAFFKMCRGEISGVSDLMVARSKLIKLSSLGSGKVPREYELNLLKRVDSLLERSRDSDCIAMCRSEVEEHSRRLSLGSVEWPKEWPLSTLS